MLSDESEGLTLSCPLPLSNSSVIRLGHGSGGKMTAQLIESVFLPLIGNEILNKLDDAALVEINGATIAITTDSYVVSPIFFPGGNIGSLAVYGTVNDLAMRGAKPLFLTASFILEEGLPLEDLTKIIESTKRACIDAEVQLVAADTKVVNRGAADRLFITTSGVGVIDKLPAPAANRAQPGDYVVISGDIGRHGVAIMACREGLDLETTIESDSCPLHRIVLSMQKHKEDIHCIRDITRGGLASVLNELAAASQVGIEVDEESIPVHPEVQAVCELLGLDPLFVACEGRLVTIVAPDACDGIISNMKTQCAAEGSVNIGRVVDEHPGRVILRSRVGGKRILDKLSGEQLPRIC